jgi:hypothetical protein
MKRITRASLVAAIVGATWCDQAVALPPPAAPFTLWNFLGIPQGINKIRDATTNRRGNFPGLERKPPMKALADPKNLESPVSAIKKAAEIKTEEDLAPQKIKAIKYLATVGCGCYGGVKEALIEALDDCTEEVRYQTVLAIEDAATMHCDVCNQDCCCDEEMSKKLAELAYELNDKGCFKEPSERVREAAKSAMRACCPGQGPIGEEIPSQPPVETIPPEETIPAPPEPTPPPPDPTTRLDSTPKTITAARVRQGRTKVVMPQGDAIVSDAIETEEHVTVDFGNGSQGPAVAPVVTSRRTASAPATQKATPASTRRKKKVTEGGPSSRRAAIERGLAAPDETAQLRQPIGAISKLQTAAADESQAAETVAYMSDEQAVPGVSLAPKTGPPAVAQPEISKPRQSVHGTVARVSKETGTVEIRLDNAGDRLAQGDCLKVSHDYLLYDGHVVGYLEVMSASPRGIVARPLGTLKLDAVSRGDHATLEVARSATTSSRTESARRLPTVDSPVVSH